MENNNMNFSDFTCGQFAEVLASKEPVPGGGGASAYVGALGIALGAMVGSLTIGKAKYADVQDEITELRARANRLRERFVELVAEDAESFAPLAKAYGLPADTETEKREKAEVLERALLTACGVPLEIMRLSCEAIDLNGLFAEKGSRLAVSDAGAGAVFCKAALVGASLNVFINTKLMTDRAVADGLNADAEKMIAEYGEKADRVLADVRSML